MNDKSSSSSSSLSKRKDTLKNSLNLFLPLLKKDRTISNCTSKGDLNNFFAWKYDSSRSLVNKKNCTFWVLRIKSCECPRR